MRPRAFLLAALLPLSLAGCQYNPLERLGYALTTPPAAVDAAPPPPLPDPGPAPGRPAPDRHAP